MNANRSRITRRGLLKGSAASAVATLAPGIYMPAIANTDPIQIGYLPAFTGPSSSTGIGIGRGTELAVQEINAAGGIKGRKLEMVMRDTQSDPTKAVNAAAELTRRHKVTVMWGPLNSGETAAAIQNMLLRAYDLGLGSLWIGDVFYAYDAIREYFKKGWKLSGAVSLGYADDGAHTFQRKNVDEVAEFIS